MTPGNPSNNDTQLSLGEFLRQERERRGITIEQVASATKVGVRILHSLESDQFSELPAKPFIRGFVTSYVRFIGLDPKEVLTRFNDYIDRKAHDRPSRDEGHSGYAFEKREGERSRTILWFVLGGFAVLGLPMILYLKPLRHHHGSHLDKLRAAHNMDEPLVDASGAPALVATDGGVSAPAVNPSSTPVPKEVVATPVVEAPKPANPTAVVADSSASQTADSAADSDSLNSGVNLKPSEIKHKLVFKALDDVRVRYKVDDRPSMKFILRKDRVLVLRGKDQVRFQVSDPKSMKYNYNNQGFKLIDGDSNTAMRQNDATLVFPVQLKDSIQDPFPGDKSISATPVPRKPVPITQPSPTP